MLARLAACEAPGLRLFVLEQSGTGLAVALNLDHAGESWAYNTGFAPKAARLSPGLVVRQASIRDAIERGARRYDLGPGDFLYKREMGGECCDRVRIEAADGSPAGRALRIASLSRRRLRRVVWVRTALGTFRSATDRAGR
jgi:CelD/BcsL family acetyltransferase involved in cellulose biosynthesis